MGFFKCPWGLLVMLALAGTACAPRGVEISRPPGTLPAYAHNDYKNRTPLGDALRLGYRGVEVDYFLVDGALLVAHDRGDVRRDRTLRALYLEPLRQIVADSGRICPGGQTFILNIEAKENDAAGFAALHGLLLEYREILTRVEHDREIAGPVQVILVGWHPPLSELREMPVRCVAVQSYFRDLPADHAAIPAHLLRLVTVQYPQHFTWQGSGSPPPEFGRHLAALTAARDAVPGRLLRVFKVPRRRAVYDALRRGGVDLIGTKTISRSAHLLADD
jgi:hypothetical protein